ncbi:uncharacterized protein YdhG (YjbR/CyaY superfamily) [Chitinophaga dinghuensis]|uniref:Uncharacterized protein YdhG (YjbR/CyaY superfamily) n=1 Tax=Chitinophaga dinghuensis TaxID=1539050 RepID=A0A327W4T1_9BACT|nr:DUF1801 domain-containing protein [Chitinophaga dinghuensis]RAJ83175.1 uncharacterized protein YdhG (YjbR/CyaY superfamily) [Chitinophaga dinghuensis]
MERPNVTTIDAYIATFPPKVQKILKEVRSTIKKVAPKAEEKISYGIPTFALHGNLVHFAGYAHHIGFYPASSGISHFEKELSSYKTSKGAVQFPIDAPMPLELITTITAFRVKENEEKAAAKVKKTKSDSLVPGLSAPACRALAGAGITTLKRLSGYTEKDILQLHGMGKSSLPIMREALEEKGLSFKS